MVIFGVYIVSKSGGLIYNHDHNVPKVETEKSFNFPLDIILSYKNKKTVVVFGQRDGINGKFTGLLSTIFTFSSYVYFFLMIMRRAACHENKKNALRLCSRWAT